MMLSLTRTERTCTADCLAGRLESLEVWIAPMNPMNPVRWELERERDALRRVFEKLTVALRRAEKDQRIVSAKGC